jgi:hypothetical protein
MIDPRKSGHHENHRNTKNQGPKAKITRLLPPNKVDPPPKTNRHLPRKAARNRLWKKNQRRSRLPIKQKKANKK